MANTPDDAAKDLQADADRLKSSRLQSMIIKDAKLAMVGDVRHNFDTSSDPFGVPWARLRHPRVRGGDKPLFDTGTLMRSVTTQAITRETDTSIEIGTAQPGATLHQQGGTVVPVRAKALAIPLTREAYQLGLLGDGPRQFPRPLSMLWRRGARSGVLAEITKPKGKRGKIKTILHYALVKSVTVPARPFLGFGPRLMTRLEKIVTNAVQKVFGGKP